MKKWRVTLPNNQHFEMESDSPHTDLAARGHDRYALEELFPTPPAWREQPGANEGDKPHETTTPRYDIPDDVIDTTVKALDKLAILLEAEAAALASVHTREGALRAAELLEEAEDIRKASDFFARL